MKRTQSQRGMTLTESVSSIAVGLVAIGVGMSMLLIQNSSLQKQSGVGNAVNQNQVASDAISGAIHLAGKLPRDTSTNCTGGDMGFFVGKV